MVNVPKHDVLHLVLDEEPDPAVQGVLSRKVFYRDRLP